MLDGIYQSVICFYVTYLLFMPATFVTKNGQDINDHERMGVYVACAVIIVVNTYILLNSYRWDWLMLLLVAISILLVFFWTGVYGAFESSGYFYHSAPQVFGQATFWATVFVTVIMALMPRFLIKAFQKVYYPYDVDVIREQVRQGKFAHLDKSDGSPVVKSPSSSTTSSAIAKPSKQYPTYDDDRRPIYPPSVAATATTTHNPRSQNGSDGTEYTRHRPSLDAPLEDAPTPISRTVSNVDRPRPSFDRMRASMDRIRPSYEASHDFTSAAMLTRLESSQSFGPIRSRRRHDISDELRQ
jgi:phospholipid-translocating ATPase